MSNSEYQQLKRYAELHTSIAKNGISIFRADTATATNVVSGVHVGRGWAVWQTDEFYPFVPKMHWFATLDAAFSFVGVAPDA